MPEPPADLWAGMDAIDADSHQPRFKGFTYMEYSMRYGISRSTAQHRLEVMVIHGKVEQGWKQSGRTWIRVFRATSPKPNPAK